MIVPVVSLGINNGSLFKSPFHVCFQWRRDIASLEVAVAASQGKWTTRLQWEVL